MKCPENKHEHEIMWNIPDSGASCISTYSLYIHMSTGSDAIRCHLNMMTVGVGPTVTTYFIYLNLFCAVLAVTFI